MTAHIETSTHRETGAAHGPQAVHRALEVLTLIVDSAPLSLSDIARSTGLPPSTTMRMLRALEHWGYVVRLPDGDYSRGERFVQSQLMANAPNAQELIDLSAPVMKRLTTQTQESSYLAVPGPAGTCTFLREVQSPLPLRYVGFDGWEGRTVPMAGSVTGEVLGQRVPAEGYVVMATVTDPDSTAIGAPVRLENGSIIAVLSLAGPSFRLTEDSVRRHGEAIKAAAAELGAALK